MEVYVEYVLIENFAVDFTLFSLTRKFVKHKGGKVRAVFASVAGAVYATIAPLLSLTGVIAYILKFSFPVLACAFVFWEKGKWTKNLSKIGLSIAVFFALSFAYAGGLIAVFNLVSVPYFWSEKGYILTKIPVASAILGFFGFILFTKKTVKKIYERKNALAFVYPCKIRAYGREMETDCFVDSGNLAKVGEVPLCFVSMSLFFDLRFPLPQNEKKERIKIRTVGGEKWVEAYLAEELEIYLERGANRIEKVYFSPSSSLSGREYQVLVGAWAVSA